VTVPVTPTLPLMGTGVARSWLSVRGPVTATEPDTTTVPDTGCVACQNVPVTETGDALSSVFVSPPPLEPPPLMIATGIGLVLLTSVAVLSSPNWIFARK
jgi:hypothetical protein